MLTDSVVPGYKLCAHRNKQKHVAAKLLYTANMTFPGQSAYTRLMLKLSELLDIIISMTDICQFVLYLCYICS